MTLKCILEIVDRVVVTVNQTFLPTYSGGFRKRPRVSGRGLLCQREAYSKYTQSLSNREKLFPPSL